RSLSRERQAGRVIKSSWKAPADFTDFHTMTGKLATLLPAAQAFAMRFLLALLITTTAALAADLPRPLPDHPGNIFTAGENVTIAVSATQPAWRLRDYDGQTKSIEAQNGKLDLGKLPIGYYELRRADEKDNDPDKTTIGVIAPLQSPTPNTSPI